MSGKTMLKRSYSYLIIVSCFTVLLSSCVSPLSKKPAIQVPQALVQSQTQWHKEYVLAAGDQIEVVVRRFPDLTKTLTVRPDGAISLPIVNDVPAKGLTAAELGVKLTQLLAPRLVNPEVTVIAVQTRQPMVYVIGDTTNVVAVPFRTATNAAQAVALAGGLKRTGATRSISIVRLGQDGYLRAIPLTVEDESQPGTYMALRQTPLEPDDIVFVPENNRSQITRILEDFVNKPLFEANLLLQPYLTFRYVQSITQ